MIIKFGFIFLIQILFLIFFFDVGMKYDLQMICDIHIAFLCSFSCFSIMLITSPTCQKFLKCAQISTFRVINYSISILFLNREQKIVLRISFCSGVIIR